MNWTEWGREPWNDRETERRREHRGDQQLDRIENLLYQLNRSVTLVAIDQTTFDQDLAALVAAIGALVTAVDAISSKPPADLTAEDQTVIAAAASVKAELDKLAPVPAPVDVPPADVPPAF